MFHERGARRGGFGLVPAPSRRAVVHEAWTAMPGEGTNKAGLMRQTAQVNGCVGRMRLEIAV